MNLIYRKASSSNFNTIECYTGAPKPDTARILAVLYWVVYIESIIRRCWSAIALALTQNYAGTGLQLRRHWYTDGFPPYHWIHAGDLCRQLTGNILYSRHPGVQISSQYWPDSNIQPGPMLFFSWCYFLCFCFVFLLPHAWLAETQAYGLSRFCSSRARAKTLLQILIIILL